MFLSKLKQKFICSKRKEIPLNLLSRLWTEKEPIRQPSFQNPTQSKWAHEDIHQFYTQYISPSFSILGPAGPTIDQILTLLDHHGDCPSSLDDSETEKAFAGITLREHSMTVARIAVDMIKKAHRDYEVILSKILIICLGHSFGILSSANIIGGIPARSILILDPLIQDLPFKQDIITAIRTFGDNHPKTDEAKILKAANTAARKNELERLTVISKIGCPDIFDIKKIRAAIQSPEGKS
jgi:hypothetical protein